MRRSGLFARHAEAGWKAHLPVFDIAPEKRRGIPGLHDGLGCAQGAQTKDGAHEASPADLDLAQLSFFIQTHYCFPARLYFLLTTA